MDDAGNTKDDLKLPTGTDDADKLARDIKAEFSDGKEMIVTVVSVRPSMFCHHHRHTCPQSDLILTGSGVWLHELTLQTSTLSVSVNPGMRYMPIACHSLT